MRSASLRGVFLGVCLAALAVPRSVSSISERVVPVLVPAFNEVRIDPLTEELFGVQNPWGGKFDWCSGMGPQFRKRIITDSMQHGQIRDLQEDDKPFVAVWFEKDQLALYLDPALNRVQNTELALRALEGAFQRCTHDSGGKYFLGIYHQTTDMRTFIPDLSEKRPDVLIDADGDDHFAAIAPRHPDVFHRGSRPV